VNLPNLSELSKIIDLCRKKGVESIKIDNVELTLSREAPPSKYKRKTEAASDFVTIEQPYSEEDALFWSAPSTFEEVKNG